MMFRSPRQIVGYLVIVLGLALTAFALFLTGDAMLHPHPDRPAPPWWFLAALAGAGVVPICYVFRRQLAELLGIAAPFIPRVTMGNANPLPDNRKDDER